MIIHQVEQGSEEWHQLRLGIPTASCFDKILTAEKLALSKSSAPYMHTLLAEWIFGAPLESFEGGWMKRGKDLEAEAVSAYEFQREVDSSTVGFVTTDDGMIGASPDRLVGSDGLLEMKCPALQTHVGYMLNPQSLKDEYRIQTQGQLWVCGDREWSDIVSFYPGFPLVVVRSNVDTKASLALSTHIPAFVETMLKCREALTREYGELRRERVTAAQRLAENHAAFDAFMESPIGGNV